MGDVFLGDFPSPYQEPKNLTKDPAVALDVVRAGEIENIGDRIAQAKVWIKRKSKTINVVRALLVVSPIVFLIAVGIYKRFA